MSLYTLRQQVMALTDVLQTIETQLASFQRSKPSAVAFDANASPASTTVATRRFPPSIWPRVGGLGRLEPTADRFACDAYRNAYRPGLARQIYVGACFGLRRLSATLQVPLQKVSTCSAGRLMERMKEVSVDEYASEYSKDGRYVADRDGFRNWYPAHLHTSVRPAVNSPVSASARALTVTLPDTMSAAEFDLAFDAEVRKASIADWVATPEGRRHCAARGVDPALACRATPYPYGDVTRHSHALEIIVFRTRDDVDRLINLAERIVLKKLGLIG